MNQVFLHSLDLVDDTYTQSDQPNAGQTSLNQHDQQVYIKTSISLEVVSKQNHKLGLIDWPILPASVAGHLRLSSFVEYF